MAVSEKTDEVVAGLGDDTRQYAYKKNLRTALPQLLAVSIKNLLILGYGMTLGFQTILIPAVKNPIANEVLHLDQNEISWISSLNLIVVPLGCAMSGVVTAPLGRRRAMQMVNIPFFIAWLMFHFATTTGHLYGALFLVGLGGGLLEAPVLTYVAEITQPHLRGALTATSSMCIIIGVFTQFLFGLFLYWRTVALVNIVFTILAVVALSFVPESPHWLVSRKRYDDARKSLQWLRGWTTSNMVEDELRDIQALFKTKKVESEDQAESMLSKLENYTNKSFIVPFFLVCYSFFVGHFSGMTTLQVYAVSIFEMLQAPIDKYYATLILGILQIIGSSLCVLLVHYIGKRPLTFISTLGPGICCILVACYDYIYVLPNSVSNNNNMTIVSSGSISSNISNETLVAEERNIMNNPYSWIPTVLLMLLALITHIGIRLLPWILIGEVFSAKTRSGGAGLSSGVGYIFNFLTNKIYLSLVGNLSIWGTYGIYGIVCLTGCLVLYFILPETEGKKLKEIQDHFAGIRKMDNKVYRSKRRSKIDGGKLREVTGTVNPSFDVASTQL